MTIRSAYLRYCVHDDFRNPANQKPLRVLRNLKFRGNPANTDKWCHIAGYPVTHGVIIVRDATEGDYRAWHGQWRRWHIWCTDVDNENGMENARMRGRTYNMANSSALHEYTFHYTNTDDFNRFAEYAIIYTARGIAFTTEIPKGLTKLDLPN